MTLLYIYLLVACCLAVSGLLLERRPSTVRSVLLVAFTWPAWVLTILTVVSAAVVVAVLLAFMTLIGGRRVE